MNEELVGQRIDAPPDTMTGNTKIGVITVEKGEIRFNGELLEDQPLKALGNLCMETEKASK